MQNRRRVRVVNPRFQWKYASLVAITIFLTSALASVFLFFALHQQARERLIHPESSSPQVTLTILCFALGWSAVGGGMFALVSLVFTNRICGAALVLQRYFRELSEGRLPKVRPLRTKDEFKELVEDFGDAVNALRDERQRMFALAEDAVTLARSQSQTSGPLGESVTRLVSRLEDERLRLQAATEQPSRGTEPQGATAPRLASA